MVLDMEIVYSEGNIKIAKANDGTFDVYGIYVNNKREFVIRKLNKETTDDEIIKLALSFVGDHNE